MKNFLLFIAFISLSYFVNAQCNVTTQEISAVLCFGGNNGVAAANPSGGTPPYTYTWSPAGGNSQTANNLFAGTYTCTVTDALSCVTFSSVTINEPTVLAANASTINNVSCFGGCNGSATVAPAGGVGPYTYLWSPTGGNSITGNNLCAGTYTISVTDGNGCLSTSTAIITEPPMLVASSVSVNDVLCYGDCNASVTVLANGGTGPYTYSWNPTGQTTITATGLCEGGVDVTVTDSQGCTFTSGDSIWAPPPFTGNACSVVNATCGNSDGSASICASGGIGPYTYLWSTAPPQTGTTATGLPAGVYTATATDANGCTTLAIASINNGINVSVISHNNVSCSSCCDGGITVSASGGTPPYTYFWTPAGGNAATASNLCTGTYTCTVTDANSCSGIVEYAITDLYPVSGSVYFDTNQNGIWDVGEPYLSNHTINVTPGNITAYTNSNGDYTALVHAGSNTISYSPPPTFTQTSLPVTYTVSVPPAQSGLDFGTYSAAAQYDQDFYVWHHSMRCAPSLGYTYVEVSNTGLLPESGSVTMVHSSNMPFNTSSPLPDAINGDTLVWHYINLQPFQTYTIGGGPWISFNDPPAGNTVWYTTVDSVTDLAGNPVTQYTDSFSFVVNCSCDPNDKEVNPPGFLAQHYTAINSELTYTLNFQNTGNDTAFNVAILDTLNTNLNLSTFKVVGSSHTVSTEILPGRIARFTFANIQLPDSNVDFNGSNAYVAYSIKPNNALPDLTVINNTAHIFFDSNPAVATNMAYNTFTNSPLSVSRVFADDGYVIIYPNPFHSSATLILNEQFKEGEIIIYDAVGNEVQKSKVTNQKSEISNLSAGVYFLKVAGAKSRIVKKLIVY